MKKFMTKVVALAAAAVATCSMAFADPVSLEEAKTDGAIVLDGTEATAPKMYQININDFNDGTSSAIAKITLTGKGTGWAEADWVGGGGGIGFNRTDEDGTWVQVDFNIDGGAWKADPGVTGTIDGDDFTVELDFTKIYESKGVDPGTNWADDQFLQIGWWWSTNDVISITDIKVDFVPGTAQVEPAADPEPATDPEPAADPEPAPATDNPPKTGDATSVAVLAVVALVAMGGVVVTSKKRA